MAKQAPERMPYSPSKHGKLSVPESVKAEVEAKATELIEKVLRPKHVKPPQKGRQFYLTGFATKWIGLRCSLRSGRARMVMLENAWAGIVGEYAN